MQNNRILASFSLKYDLTDAILQDIEKMRVQYLRSLSFEKMRVQYLRSLSFDSFEILQALRIKQRNSA